MIKDLEPREVFREFAEILRVPRPSKHEEQMIAYLMSWADNHGIACRRDAAGNVVMRKPASRGREQEPSVVLQAHMDMVCEKDSNVSHDFLHDAIDAYLEDGWLHARGTTLGADDGIGLSMALAVLASDDISHPALECLFTVDEETGLSGAANLAGDMFTGKTLINLDNEDDGNICIGCAGGIDTLGKQLAHYVPVPDGYYAAQVRISGLMGGHSGDDINKGRANANQLLTRYMFAVMSKTDVRIADIDGGNLHNAIAREASAILCVPFKDKEALRTVLNIQQAMWEAEYGSVEKDMEVSLESVDVPHQSLAADQSKKLIETLYACPHGVMAMSRDIEGLVETSTNLASVKIKDGEIIVNTSQRSSVESAKHDIKNKVECALRLGGFDVSHGDGYPGWKPNPQSALLDKAVDAYQELFHSEPVVLAIHAGLECGLFLEKYRDLDMIAIGPQMYGVHSPSERLEIASTQRTWQWLKRILAK